jgi:hypothetical protein
LVARSEKSQASFLSWKLVMETVYYNRLDQEEEYDAQWRNNIDRYKDMSAFMGNGQMGANQCKAICCSTYTDER